MCFLASTYERDSVKVDSIICNWICIDIGQRPIVKTEVRKAEFTTLKHFPLDRTERKLKKRGS